MEKLIRRIGLVAHDAMKKDLIEWVLWNSELLMGHKFYCTGTTGTLIQEALKEKHPDVEWDFTILKSGPLGGDQQMGSRIVDGEIDYLFFFTDPMTLQPHDTDVKALTRLASVENIVFCCNRSTADHIISSPLFLDPDYERTHPDYSGYTKRFENKPVVTEAVESVKKKKEKEIRAYSVTKYISLQSIQRARSFNYVESLYNNFVLSVYFVARLLCDVSVPAAVFPPIFVNSRFMYC